MCDSRVPCLYLVSAPVCDAPYSIDVACREVWKRDGRILQSDVLCVDVPECRSFWYVLGIRDLSIFNHVARSLKCVTASIL